MLRLIPVVFLLAFSTGCSLYKDHFLWGRFVKDDQISSSKKFNGMTIGIINISGPSTYTDTSFAMNQSASCLTAMGADVIEREQIVRLLEEMHFQMTGATDQDNTAKVGKLLNMKYAFFGKYNWASGNWLAFSATFSGRIVDVETGKTIRSGSSTADGNTIDEAVIKSVNKFFKSI